jgi:hypothetical protein
MRWDLKNESLVHSGGTTFQAAEDEWFYNSRIAGRKPRPQSPQSSLACQMA